MIPLSGVNDEETDDAPDVAPPVVIQILTLSWIVLFGGRWIVVSLLQWNGLIAPDAVAAFDSGPFAPLYFSGLLVPIYLVLLACTILIVALRFARRFSAPSSVSRTLEAERPSASRPDSRQEPRKP